ncbi:MAG: RecX family transcriptional regulator [Chitinophagaceae bacterium]|nr:RecX family transcriptional regulator [Chitinophagaceae bacterium]
MSDELLKKLAHYCAYQERSHREVKTKLLELGARGLELENIIVELISQNYLNEERFAKAFAGGKFRTKKWGKVKIIQELKKHFLSEYVIKKAMKEIPDDDYEKAIEYLIEKKMDTLKNIKNKVSKKQKVMNYLLQKGYSYQDIQEKLTNFIS